MQYAFELNSTAVLYLTEWNGSFTCDSVCTNSFHNLQTCSQRARDFPFTCEKITSITSGFKYGTILLFAFVLLLAAETSSKTITLTIFGTPKTHRLKICPGRHGLVCAVYPATEQYWR